MEEIKTNQDPVSQSIQFNQPNVPVTPRNNNIYKYLFFIAVVLLLGVVAGFYFVLNNKINQLSNKQTVELTSDSTQLIDTNDETIPTIIPTVASTESTLVQKDANNNLYTNNKFGFSLVVPKLAIDSIECKKESDSYRLASGLVPVTFFENKDIIYLASDYFYRLTGEQKTDGRSNFSGCEKLKTTFDLIEKGRQESEFSIASLKIYTTDIKNDTEIEDYFKTIYGTGCRLGKKTLSDIPDIYNVKMLGDYKGLDETECDNNGRIETFYSPTKAKLVIFELGQDCVLSKNLSGVCYDSEILKSFKFN